MPSHDLVGSAYLSCLVSTVKSKITVALLNCRCFLFCHCVRNILPFIDEIFYCMLLYKYEYKKWLCKSNTRPVLQNCRHLGWLIVICSRLEASWYTHSGDSERGSLLRSIIVLQLVRGYWSLVSFAGFMDLLEPFRSGSLKLYLKGDRIRMVCYKKSWKTKCEHFSSDLIPVSDTRATFLQSWFVRYSISN